MAKISTCFKRTFVFFNAIFAIIGIIIFALGLFLHQYVQEASGLYAVIFVYFIGCIVFTFAALGAYGAHKESKCALITFFVLMCLATVGTLRLAIPVAVSRDELISLVRDYLKSEIPLDKEAEITFASIQEHFHCCGLLNGYSDWKDKVPESCNCVEPREPTDTCETIKSGNTYKNWLSSQLETRRVWSKPCGPIFISYLEMVMTIMMGVLFSLAVLAIFGGLMSLGMIIRITAPANTQLPGLPLTYQPPKYSEVVNY